MWDSTEIQAVNGAWVRVLRVLTAISAGRRGGCGWEIRQRGCP